MFKVINKFFTKKFSNPEAAALLIVIIVAAIIVLFFGKLLAPILAGLVIAFLCEPLVIWLHKYCKFPRMLSVVVVFLIFIGVLVLAVIGLLPMLGKQLGQAINEVPQMLKSFHGFLTTLPAKYPDYIHDNTIQNLVNTTTINPAKFSSIGKAILSYSAHSIGTIITALIYLFLVPLSVLFFLKDKDSMLAWLKKYMPAKSGLVNKVGAEMQVQLANYVRGKFIEIIIVGVGTYIIFWIFGLNYALLLATLVAVSVIIPYVGMVIVSIPVILVGLVQWGLDPQFVYMLIAYFVYQALDGNLLVPILYSEAVNLHPVAIIAAVLFFGGIWGFWGLFFAIPLATLVKTLINAWSKAG